MDAMQLMDDKMIADRISDLASTFLVYHKNFFKTFILPLFGNIDGGEKEKSLERLRRDDSVLTADEIEVVVRRLGMPPGEEDEEGELSNGTAVAEGGGVMMNVIDELLEEKNASLEELRQAFRVFDANEDGAISPGELWCVMRRLGLQEGLKLSTCEAMIRAFDEDGDGTINFKEFTSMMEKSS